MSIKQLIYLTLASGIVLVELSVILTAWTQVGSLLASFFLGLSLIADAVLVIWIGTEEGIL
jgi:hypothetical protein